MPQPASPVPPSPAHPRRISAYGLHLAGMLALGLGFWASMVEGTAQVKESSKQVTLFGIRAIPGSKSVDPRLATIAPHLRQILPGHGFKLIDARTRRLEVGESLKCKLVDGFEASTGLLDPFDPDGKVQLRFILTEQDGQAHETIVATPVNQLFFADRTLPDGSRLLLGMGAR